ncbi:uncharacterized protein LOC143149954 [Ptiloglossa arizonensis]|uniref:uncharacterized protein LOC143149954 n=1 Tax=Ptiloglossa arizonensis TaxID=3350558 RepID=UPI003FA156DB
MTKILETTSISSLIYFLQNRQYKLTYYRDHTRMVLGEHRELNNIESNSPGPTCNTVSVLASVFVRRGAFIILLPILSDQLGHTALPTFFPRDCTKIRPISRDRNRRVAYLQPVTAFQHYFSRKLLLFV